MTWNISAVLLYLLHVVFSTKWCDRNQTTWHREGLIGERSVFPWLGVLRVHIHNRNKFSVAITGIVLVKEDYAIANAQEVSQVPREHIIADSKAMFVISDYSQWLSGVREVTVHPHFELDIFNSIALLQLWNTSTIPPICWTTSSSPSDQLYALGYTDRNKALEKVLYKMNPVETDLCQEFYNRAGYKPPIADEEVYVCGFAPSITEHCEWDSGMVMATNNSGYWQLMGLGVRGPGCAAPARFISMSRYLPWIQSVLDHNKPIYNKYYID